MSSIVEFKNVSKSFVTSVELTKVLEDVSFNIKKGQIVSIVGPSGCGKSTILNIIAGLENVDEGEVNILGNIGYMFQKDNLMSWRNVYENITIGLEIQRKMNLENKTYIDDLLNKYELNEFKYFYPKQLSGGMKQRVAIIRTLALNPDLLLLDEPFSALDYQTKLTVQEDIYKIIKNEQKTTILVTHDITEAIAMSDVVIVLSYRPAHIKEIINIDFNDINRTPLSARNHPHFQAYFNNIWREIHDE
jgi:NitT/TauT family transport system ATP-binding protein